MATITEDYVSFDIAKLLKEKGFDEPIQYFYKFDSKELYRGTVFTNTQIGDKFYNAPTLQMAMKWLREEHNISIEISSCCKIENCEPVDLGWVARKIDLTKMIGSAFLIGRYDTYEMACEAAIKYCLERLI